MPEQALQKLRVILTGATGMVGEGVLHECLQHPDVESVLIVGRKPSGVIHPKVKEVLHKDFFDLSPVADQLAGYNACLFCLGVSSIGMKEPEFYRMTYELTMHFAKTVSAANADMVFCYISGAGTDSTAQGKTMWARVKGKTENDLLKLPFKRVYNFRPGILQPTPGLKNTLSFYKYLGWILPIINMIAPKYVLSLEQLGNAMIKASLSGYHKNVLEVTDIKLLASSN